MQNSPPHIILDISADASDTEIKKTFRRLAKNWHPDRYRGSKEYGEEQFKRIKQAYETMMSMEYKETRNNNKFSTTSNTSNTSNRQGNLPFGQANVPVGQANVPFGQGNIPFRQDNLPFGQANIPFGQGNIPFGQGNIPFGQGNIPFGQGNGPFNPGNIPFTQGNIPVGPGQSNYYQRNSRFSTQPPSQASAASVLGNGTVLLSGGFHPSRITPEMLSHLQNITTRSRR